MNKLVASSRETVSAAITLICLSLTLFGCSAGDRVHLLYEATSNTKEHKELVANPKMLVGNYYEADAAAEIIGSVSFEAAVELQNLEQLPDKELKGKYSQQGNVDYLKSRNVVLNDGLNEENAKANLLMKVIDGASTGAQSTAVRVLVLNKKYAGQKYWIGSQLFLVRTKKTSCPVNDASQLGFDAPATKHSKIKDRKSQVKK